MLLTEVLEQGTKKSKDQHFEMVYRDGGKRVLKVKDFIGLQLLDVLKIMDEEEYVIGDVEYYVILDKYGPYVIKVFKGMFMYCYNCFAEQCSFYAFRKDTKFVSWLVKEFKLSGISQVCMGLDVKGVKLLGVQKSADIRGTKMVIDFPTIIEDEFDGVPGKVLSVFTSKEFREQYKEHKSILNWTGCKPNRVIYKVMTIEMDVDDCVYVSMRNI